MKLQVFDVSRKHETLFPVATSELKFEVATVVSTLSLSILAIANVSEEQQEAGAYRRHAELILSPIDMAWLLVTLQNFLKGKQP